MYHYTMLVTGIRIYVYGSLPDKKHDNLYIITFIYSHYSFNVSSVFLDNVSLKGHSLFIFTIFFLSGPCYPLIWDVVRTLT